MLVYALCWGGGLFASVVAAALVLRRRSVLSVATLLASAASVVGWLYGAKVQYRLETLPPLEAVLVSPMGLFVPGYHIPLGLVGALAFATLVGFFLRAPLLTLGDAVAVGGLVSMPIGRIGCLLSGCCTGVACSAWLRPLCVRLRPGSESYFIQVEAGLIPPNAPASLPVHALPAYFALASLAILMLSLWLLRRGARPGSLAATAFFLYPLAQLGLEHLRAGAAPAADEIMRAVLLGTVAADALVVAVVIARRRHSARARDPYRRLLLGRAVSAAGSS